MYKLLHYWSEVFSLERLANIGRQIAQVGDDTHVHTIPCVVEAKIAEQICALLSLSLPHFCMYTYFFTFC